MLITKATPSRAASATMSAHDTIPSHSSSTRDLMVSMISWPRTDKLGGALFSPVNVGVSSRRREASHPRNVRKEKVFFFIDY